MERAREIAVDGGLEVTPVAILDPPAAPSETNDLTGNISGADRDYAVQAQQQHAEQVAAYDAAKAEADLGRGLWESAKTTADGVWGALTEKAGFTATDLVNSIAGGTAGSVAKVLTDHSSAMREMGARHMEHFRAAATDPAAARMHANAAQEALGEADDAARRGATWKSVGRGLPVVGLGITAASIGYDVDNGKPAGKAVVSGLAGFGASVAAGAAIGGPVGAVVGVGAGVVTSGLADAAYDSLPQGVQDGIEAGAGAVGETLGDAAGAVGGTFNAIF